MHHFVDGIFVPSNLLPDKQLIFQYWVLKRSSEYANKFGLSEAYQATILLLEAEIRSRGLIQLEDDFETIADLEETEVQLETRKTIIRLCTTAELWVAFCIAQELGYDETLNKILKYLQYRGGTPDMGDGGRTTNPVS